MTLHRGRLTQLPDIRSVRPLTREDLEEIKSKRSLPVVARFRDPHHRVARLIAAGLRPNEVAEATGYSLSRIYVLSADPAFQNQVAEYRKDVHTAYVSAEEEHYAMATEVNRKALRHIAEAFDKADEEGELVPIDKALRVFADTADRVGIQKRSTNVHVNLDFAAKLEAAIARSGKVIDVTPNPTKRSA
jgi:hypothetical protein